MSFDVKIIDKEGQITEISSNNSLACIFVATANLTELIIKKDLPSCKKSFNETGAVNSFFDEMESDNSSSLKQAFFSDNTQHIDSVICTQPLLTIKKTEPKVKDNHGKKSCLYSDNCIEISIVIVALGISVAAGNICTAGLIHSGIDVCALMGFTSCSVCCCTVSSIGCDYITASITVPAMAILFLVGVLNPNN